MSWQYDANSSTMQWQNDGNGDPSKAGRDNATRQTPGTGGSKAAGVPEFKGTGHTFPAAPAQGPVLPPSTAPVFPGYTPPTAPGAQPISFNGGKQQFNPTTAPFGMDMTAPGVNEQFWNNNQNLWFQSPQLDWVDSLLPKFETPWAGEQANQQLMGTIANPGAGQQFWNSVRGTFNQQTPAEQTVSNGYKGPNRADEAFKMTKGAMPGSLRPQFDAYYDRMADKAMSNVNTQSAARGTYGSNSALNGAIGAGLDVEAQRAKAATDFSLQDSQNQLSWLNGLANQGRNADLSGLGAFGANLDASRMGLDKIKTFGDLAFASEGMDFNKNKALSDIAFGVDDQALERMGAGISTAFNSDQAHRGRLNDAFDASNITQGNREDRINGLYDDVTNFSNDTMSFLQQNYNAILGGDMNMSDQELQTMIAQAADERGWDQQQQERIFRDVKGFVDAATAKKQSDEA